MCNERCGFNRFNNRCNNDFLGEEAFLEAEVIMNDIERNRCHENRCARQFVRCLRDGRCDRDRDRCDRDRCDRDRCRCGCRCNRW